MHFLSHYYTEGCPENPLFAAALGIPDLTPGFSKVYNSKIVKMAEPVNADLKEIHRGVLRHFAGDKWFHNSERFVRKVSVICQAFVREGLDRRRLRLSVIAHLATELMIDRQIVVQEKGVCDEYYKRIMEADEGVLASYFDHLALPREKNIFITRFRFFKERKFVMLFNDLERIVFGLERIYQMVVETEFTNGEKEKFISALHNIDADMRYSWQQLLKP